MVLALAVSWVVSSVVGATVLFPTPLHLVRSIEDPIARTTTTIQQYCYGNRIVTINGARVAIEDHGDQTLTEIDHQRLTYSVTRFDEIAKARPGRELKERGAKRRVDVNRSVALSRAAVEALIGASYPHVRTAAHDEVLQAAGAPRAGRIAAQSTDAQYGLPADETVTYENGLTSRNIVVSIDNDLPPAASLLIDPGATRVESRSTRLQRELEQLDKLPSEHR